MTQIWNTAHYVKSLKIPQSLEKNWHG